MRRIFVVLLCTMYYVLSTSFARASESALSLSPAIYESVVDKGGYVKSEVFLTNLTNFPLPIKGWATAFLASELPHFSQNNYDASSWFTLEPSDFILQPSERKKIELTIKAPRSSEPGGHYATVFFQPLIPEGIVNSPTALARVGLLALLVVPGDLRSEMTIDPISLPTWQSFGPVHFELKLTNRGNVHETVGGEIKVTNLFKQIVGTIPLAPQTILPGTKKSIPLTWDRRLGVGQYTFEPILSFGATRSPLTSRLTSLWLLPWPLVLGGVLLLTIIYKLFILNSDRVKLAWRALRGNLQEKDNNHDQVKLKQKDLQKTSRLPHRRSSPHRSH